MEYPSFDDIAYFFAVCESKSFSHAAYKIGLRQSTLSIAIKRLERNLGESLFERSKKGLKLTQAGQVFRRDAREIFNQWHKVKANVQQTHHEIQGHYTIACHSSAGIVSLPPVIGHIALEHPGINLDIQTDYSGSIIDQVLKLRVDFGITGAPTTHPELSSFKILETDTMLFRNTTHEVARDTPLIYDPNALGSSYLLRRMARTSFRFHRHIRVSDMELVLALTKSKVGVGILPRKVAEREKTLKLLTDRLRYPTPISLIYNSNQQKSAASQIILDSFRMFYQ